MITIHIQFDGWCLSLVVCFAFTVFPSRNCFVFSSFIYVYTSLLIADGNLLLKWSLTLHFSFGLLKRNISFNCICISAHSMFVFFFISYSVSVTASHLSVAVNIYFEAAKKGTTTITRKINAVFLVVIICCVWYLRLYCWMPIQDCWCDKNWYQSLTFMWNFRFWIFF